jgi:putative redox protein
MEIVFEGGKVVTALTSGHRIRTDQPLDNGGGDTSPSPLDLYYASLGTCTALYIKAFCDCRNISLENIRIFLKTESDQNTDLPRSITIEIKVPEDFPEKYKILISGSAEMCKIKKIIANPPVIQVITT